MDLTELSRSSWNALRNEHQPAFDDLEESYRQRLIDRAQNVQTVGRVTEEGGVFQTFEQNVIEALNPERFHPLSKQFQPIPEEVKEELAEEVIEESQHSHDAITEAVVAVQKKKTPKKKAPKKKVAAKKVVKVIKKGAKKR